MLIESDKQLKKLKQLLETMNWSYQRQDRNL
jgi:hypothetical protein